MKNLSKSHNMSTPSENFKYWSDFIDKIIPILNDLTLSFRNAEWDLHLSAVWRIPLFFTFGHTNYCRWTPIYLEDCKNLVSTFPMLPEAFKKGDCGLSYNKKR